MNSNLHKRCFLLQLIFFASRCKVKCLESAKLDATVKNDWETGNSNFFLIKLQSKRPTACISNSSHSYYIFACSPTSLNQLINGVVVKGSLSNYCNYQEGPEYDDGFSCSLHFLRSTSTHLEGVLSFCFSFLSSYLSVFLFFFSSLSHSLLPFHLLFMFLLASVTFVRLLSFFVLILFLHIVCIKLSSIFDALTGSLIVHTILLLRKLHSFLFYSLFTIVVQALLLSFLCTC